jgi:hypothetical protein
MLCNQPVRHFRGHSSRMQDGEANPVSTDCAQLCNAARGRLRRMANGLSPGIRSGSISFSVLTTHAGYGRRRHGIDETVEESRTKRTDVSRVAEGGSADGVKSRGTGLAIESGKGKMPSKTLWMRFARCGCRAGQQAIPGFCVGDGFIERQPQPNENIHGTSGRHKKAYPSPCESHF